jgi:hypothetical protein
MRRGLAKQIFRRAFAEAARAGGEGGFDQGGAHLDRMALELDDIGRRELSEALTGLLRQADEIQRRADARGSGDQGATGVGPSSLVILHYRLPVSATPTGLAAERRRRRERRPRLPR